MIRGFVVFLFVLFCLLVYPIISLPYVVHSTINTRGIVKDVKILDVSILPDGLKDIAEVFGKRCMVLLVYDKATNTNTTAITNVVDMNVGDLVEIYDIVAEWCVDWHQWNFFNVSYDYLVVGNVQKPKSIDLMIEKTLQSNFGGIIYALSTVSFLIFPILAFLVLYRLEGLKVWCILLAVALYSLGIMELNYFSNQHDVVVQEIQKLFGYTFFILLPITLYTAWKESRENLIKKIKSAYHAVVGALADMMEER